MVLVIKPWETLTEDEQREWVKILVSFCRQGMFAGDSLPDLARRLRLEMAERLELKSSS